MSPSNPYRLLRLVDREFRELTGEPARTPPPPKLKALRINRRDSTGTWDRKTGRGTANAAPPSVS